MAARPFGSFADGTATELRRTAGLSDRRTELADELIAQVAAWPPGQTLALINAFEQFRASVMHEGWSDIPTMPRAVGCSGNELSALSAVDC